VEVEAHERTSGNSTSGGRDPPRLLESLRYLLDHGRIKPDRLVKTAAVVLERRALEPEAVRLLLRLRGGVTPDVIRRLRKVIVNLAGPPTREEEIFSGFANGSGREEGLWDELLLLAYEVDAATPPGRRPRVVHPQHDRTDKRGAGGVPWNALESSRRS
jgi:hypothetical protein